MASREKENRLYSDEQVARLPFTEPSHAYHNEWQVRKRSAFRLINYLDTKSKPLFILEVGCGNGWLSDKLAELKNSTVIGIDINKTELNQAKRIFGKKQNLKFAEGDLNNIEFDKKFDIIIFAASIQYFHFFSQIIGRAFSQLNQAGEIHILDTHFYQVKDLELARKRSRLYYESIGYGKMAEFYFHHSFDLLKSLNYKILFNPFNIKNRLFAKKDPFPWICISTI